MKDVRSAAAGAARGRVERFDAIVIGGGLVGSAIACGRVRAGLETALFDKGDDAFRASRGNFGLVWVQGKGDGAPRHQRWTRESADRWPHPAARLLDDTGIAVGHRQPGGIHICLGNEEFDVRRRLIEPMREQSGNFTFGHRAPMIAAGALDSSLAPLSARRFDVPAAV